MRFELVSVFGIGFMAFTTMFMFLFDTRLCEHTNCGPRGEQVQLQVNKWAVGICPYFITYQPLVGHHLL